MAGTVGWKDRWIERRAFWRKIKARELHKKAWTEEPAVEKSAKVVIADKRRTEADKRRTETDEWIVEACNRRTKWNLERTEVSKGWAEGG